jgi:hypothetical protein
LSEKRVNDVLDNKFLKDAGRNRGEGYRVEVRAGYRERNFGNEIDYSFLSLVRDLAYGRR